MVSRFIIIRINIVLLENSAIVDSYIRASPCHNFNTTGYSLFPAEGLPARARCGGRKGVKIVTQQMGVESVGSRTS
jgi:hypothetical protein